MPNLKDAEGTLKEVFGYDRFRPGQGEAVKALLSGQDLLAVMPTGAGKSLCYQIPALLCQGITLVVSPLISLMKDQVSALVQNGVKAAYINSTLTAKQQQMALERAIEGTYRIIYVAPERLGTEGFLNFAMKAEIAQVIVDEAHCVSQWGQDFRPAYLQIAPFLHRLPARPVVGAFTATATEQVRRDIIKLLELKRPARVMTGFDRPNLYLEVQRPADRDRALLSYLLRHSGQSGIVYCATRRAVEEVTELLRQHGIDAVRYHAGLSDEERTQAQEAFLLDNVPVIVATNAFGMGIDKSNVSFVVHYQMPKDLESYYQEAGRAGRDGEPADCCLLYMNQDIHLAHYLIDHSTDNLNLPEKTLQLLHAQAEERLRKMVTYATGRECLRSQILAYFGEETASDNCANCSNCCETKGERDVTREAGQVVALVSSLGGRYGRTTIAAILNGTKSEQLHSRELDKLSAFGCLHQMGINNIYALIDALVAEEALTLSEGEYPKLSAGHYAREILSGDFPLRMPMERDPVAVPVRHRGRDEDEALYKMLVKLRQAIAREQHVPPFVIFSNATLHDMARSKPKTSADMLRVTGVGENKMRRYGEAFLTTIGFFERRKGG